MLTNAASMTYFIHYILLKVHIVFKQELFEVERARSLEKCTKHHLQGRAQVIGDATDGKQNARIEELPSIGCFGCK
jgi:hypothetical protein